MINDNKDKKIVEIKYGELYKLGNILLTPTMQKEMSDYYTNKIMQEKMDYQNNITSYINRKHENGVKKQYNPLIVNLYENGLLTINYDEYSLKEFYIVFNNNDFHIKCINPKYNNQDYEYQKAVKFIDTTAFINLINNSNVIIKENRIIINDKNILEDIVNKWDGNLHSETKETDAIINKRMIGNDNDDRR